MDIHMDSFERKNKLPSIAIAVAVHALILGLALQTSTYITPKGKNVVDLLPPITKEEPKLEPMEKLIKQTELKPLKPWVPEMPPLFSKLQPTVITEVRTDPIVIGPSFPPNIGGEQTLIRTQTPVHQQASVDSNACEKPEYPSSSLRLGEEGVVSLAMLIGVDGRVLDARIEKSSGSRTLDKAAITGLSLCQFRPANTDGVPEKGWTKLQYAWKLDN
jgi:protein TonB